MMQAFDPLATRRIRCCAPTSCTTGHRLPSALTRTPLRPLQPWATIAAAFAEQYSPRTPFMTRRASTRLERQYVEAWRCCVDPRCRLLEVARRTAAERVADRACCWTYCCRPQAG